MRLTEYDWNILDEIQEQDEPFEVIDTSMRGRLKDSSPEQLLEAVFRLYEMELVSIKQSPIRALGQAFSERQVKPRSAAECFGDLNLEYEDYFRSIHEPGATPARKKGKEEHPIPIGIWIDITDSGQSEYDLDDYMDFWPNRPKSEQI